MVDFWQPPTVVGGAFLWQATAGHERADLRGHKGAISSLDWRADSALLATASEDGTARLWNPAGKQIKSVAAHRGGVLSIRFSRTGHWVTAGRDRKVKTWKPDGGAVADFGKMPGIALAAAFTSNGIKVIASDYTGEVGILDVKSKKLIDTLQANPARLSQRLANAKKLHQKAQEKILSCQKNVATLLAALTQGQAAHTTHENKLAKTQAMLDAERKKYEAIAKDATDEEQLVAEKNVQAAEATLAQVTNETAGLPDLAKITAQHELAQAKFVAAEQQLKKAHQTSDAIASQQQRYAEAAAHFSRETQQQQLKAKELLSAKKKLQKQKNQLALKLAKTEKALSDSQQQIERIEAGKHDFDAAEAVRKAYAEAAE